MWPMTRKLCLMVIQSGVESIARDREGARARGRTIEEKEARTLNKTRQQQQQRQQKLSHLNS